MVVHQNIGAFQRTVRRQPEHPETLSQRLTQGSWSWSRSRSRSRSPIHSQEHAAGSADPRITPSHQSVLSPELARGLVTRPVGQDVVKWRRLELVLSPREVCLHLLGDRGRQEAGAVSLGNGVGRGHGEAGGGEKN
jgi:hypothetical protein